MRRPMVLLFLLVLAGCEQSGVPAAPTPLPTNPPPLLPTATVVVARIDSGGLGLDIKEWEKRHGTPEGKGRIGTLYDQGLHEVVAPHGPIERLLVNWGDAPRVTITEARAVIPGLIPKDSKLIGNETYHPDANAITVYTDEYQSASLASVFDSIPQVGTGPDRWLGSSPGTFRVQIYTNDALKGIVSSLSFELGVRSP